MPEGDTIFKTAAALRRALLGEEIVSASAATGARLGDLPISRLVGSRLESSESRGKHLLMRFSNGLILHTHMQMSGSWHLYRSGERWRLPSHLARVVLETARFQAVCFRAPVVELLSAQQLAAKSSLLSLGPDLLADGQDWAGARQRLRGLTGVEIGPALLDQRALAGIGNVYKSEVLFLKHLSPFCRVDSLTDDVLDSLIAEARRLLLANRDSAGRVTTGNQRRGAELWVYGRAGRPCRRCGMSIQLARQRGRMTYWCAGCQAGGEQPLTASSHST